MLLQLVSCNPISHRNSAWATSDCNSQRPFECMQKRSSRRILSSFPLPYTPALYKSASKFSTEMPVTLNVVDNVVADWSGYRCSSAKSLLTNAAFTGRLRVPSEKGLVQTSFFPSDFDNNHISASKNGFVWAVSSILNDRLLTFDIQQNTKRRLSYPESYLDGSARLPVLRPLISG